MAGPPQMMPWGWKPQKVMEQKDGDRALIENLDFFPWERRISLSFFPVIVMSAFFHIKMHWSPTDPGLLPHSTASQGRGLLGLHLPISCCGPRNGSPHLSTPTISKAPSLAAATSFRFSELVHLLWAPGPLHALLPCPGVSATWLVLPIIPLSVTSSRVPSWSPPAHIPLTSSSLSYHSCNHIWVCGSIWLTSPFAVTLSNLKAAALFVFLSVSQVLSTVPAHGRCSRVLSCGLVSLGVSAPVKLRCSLSAQAGLSKGVGLCPKTRTWVSCPTPFSLCSFRQVTTECLKVGMIRDPAPRALGRILWRAHENAWLPAMGHLLAHHSPKVDIQVTRDSFCSDPCQLEDVLPLSILGGGWWKRLWGSLPACSVSSRGSGDAQWWHPTFLSAAWRCPSPPGEDTGWRCYGAGPQTGEVIRGCCMWGNSGRCWELEVGRDDWGPTGRIS